jgi:hypothetical protein
MWRFPCLDWSVRVAGRAEAAGPDSGVDRRTADEVGVVADDEKIVDRAHWVCPRCETYIDALETDVDRLRRGLRKIAHNDGGWCGDKAREILHSDSHTHD